MSQIAIIVILGLCFVSISLSSFLSITSGPLLLFTGITTALTGSVAQLVTNEDDIDNKENFKIPRQCQCG